MASSDSQQTPFAAPLSQLYSRATPDWMIEVPQELEKLVV